MKTLLNKELRLALHPTNLIFLGLAAMVLIPNYPYMVLFFYASLGVFFLCLSGRENHDIFYTVMLPVRKSDAVRARIMFACLIELAQAAITIPLAVFRNSWPESMMNQAGIEANLAFFGASSFMLGLFNFVFFTSYYKNPDKVGRAFVKGSIAEFLVVAVVEGSVAAVPSLHKIFDTYDPVNLMPKVIVLVCGLVLYVLLNIAACRKSMKSFEKLDL